MTHLDLNTDANLEANTEVEKDAMLELYKGKYPDVGHEAAKSWVESARTAVREGREPFYEEVAGKDFANNMTTLTKEWIDKQVPVEPAAPSEVENRLAKAIEENKEPTERADLSGTDKEVPKEPEAESGTSASAAGKVDDWEAIAKQRARDAE